MSADGGATGRVCARLAAVLDEETQALRAGVFDGLSGFADRKSRGLLELRRALRADGGGVGADAALAALRTAAERDLAALTPRLGAARAVCAIVARAVADAESDGCYGRFGARP